MKVRVGNGEIFDGATDTPIAVKFEPHELEELAKTNGNLRIFADFNGEDFSESEITDWLEHRADLDSDRFRTHPPEARELKDVATRE